MARYLIGLPVERSPREKSCPDSCGVCLPTIQLYSSQSYSWSSAAASMRKFQSAAPLTQQNKPMIILFAFGHPFFSSSLAALSTERHKLSIILFIFGRNFYATIRAVAPRYALLLVKQKKLLVLLSVLCHSNEQQI